jgi:hypothetical protein
MDDASAAEAANRDLADYCRVPSSQTAQAFTTEAFCNGRSRRRHVGRRQAWFFLSSKFGAAPGPANSFQRVDLNGCLVARAMGRNTAISVDAGAASGLTAAGSAHRAVFSFLKRVKNVL